LKFKPRSFDVDGNPCCPVSMPRCAAPYTRAGEVEVWTGIYSVREKNKMIGQKKKKGQERYSGTGSRAPGCSFNPVLNKFAIKGVDVHHTLNLDGCG
jgi:hypothetical protein